MFKKYVLIVCILFLCIYKGNATHIVGGEIYYDCLGGDTYQITLKIYRDCCPTCYVFDAPATVGIYDASGNLLQTLNLFLIDSTDIPPTLNNPCFIPPTDVCVKEGVYQTTVQLPPIAGGYVISYHRCCRNSAILNIFDASNVGSTYAATIPDQSIVTCNSTPRYTNFPPLFLCEGLPFTFDHSATDPDGDSLYYEFCSPFEGGDPTSPQSAPPLAPPYNFVSYNAPYSSTYPMSSLPALSLNSQTGMMAGTPDMIGRWVIGVCVSEYRNGVLLTTNKRDFQFNVVNCPNLPVASIPSQTLFCFGYQADFSENSLNAFSYHWDFGDPTTTADTSNLQNPTWTYADSGTYTVTLIINPGTLCADTSSNTFYIYPLLDPSFVRPPGECLFSNSFDFTAGGAFAGNGTFVWDFGTHASPATSTAQNPSGIVFDTSGVFPVTLTVSENGCVRSYTDNIEVYTHPVADYGYASQIACDLQPVNFRDSSLAFPPASWLWTFSDGGSSVLQNPWHMFPSTGNYFSSMIITDGHGCKDTMSMTTPLTVWPSPVAGFNLSPQDTSIFYPDVTITDASSGATGCSSYWGDGAFTNSCDTIHSYGLPGTYTVMQVVVNQYGCYDTAFQQVLIRPEFLFWIPNAFTPNGNGLNDVFRPTLLGVHEYSFMIFDRWGERIFETTDETAGWDGTLNHRLCANDVYVWKIVLRDDVKNDIHTYIGHVTLVR